MKKLGEKEVYRRLCKAQSGSVRRLFYIALYLAKYTGFSLKELGYGK